MAGCAAVAAVLGWGLVAVPAAVAAEDAVEVVVDGLNVHKDNVNGLPYKGLGLISANSTSNLLMDYKAEHPAQYWQLIDVMFGGTNPLINHVKVEMGSDTNNSTGSDAATMRTATELADASRSPGFQLAADAKTVNPGLKVSILRWTMPYWVQTAWNAGTGNDEMYQWYKETILDAYQKYGYLVDYVNPDTNETSNPDISFIKYYKNAIATDTDFANARYGIPADQRAAVEAAYHRMKIIASDENQSKLIGPALLNDADLFAMVDAVGYHYNTDDRYDGATTSNTYQPYTKLATSRDKEVWYSEGVGSFGFTDYRVNNTEGTGGASTGIGGLQSALDVANRSVKGYYRSKRTHYIFQPAIGSFYEGAQYSHKELLSARDPWSGAIHYDAAIYVMEHFTRFAKTGWENDANTAGIWRTVPEASFSGVSGTENIDGSNGAASYLTLADPDKRDFSTVAVNDSDQTKTYRVKAQNMNLGADPTAEIWETRAADAGQAADANFLHLVTELQPAADGYYTFTVKPRSIVTLTTLDKSTDPAMAQRLPQSLPRAVLDTDATGKNPATTDTTLYADDFEYAEEGTVEVGVDNGAGRQRQPYLASRGDQPRYLVDQTGAWEVGAGKLYQYLDQSMKDTGAWNKNNPNTLVGDFRWQNYKASVDVSFPDAAGGSAGLGVRQQTGMGVNDSAYNIRINRAGAWTFYKHGTAVANGTRTAANAYTLAVEAKGATITAFVNGTAVHSYVDPAPELAGRVNLSSDFYRTGFDNLKVEKVNGYTPYAVSLVDNMDSSIAYAGTWSRKSAAGDALDWHRSTSTSSTAGASVTVGFTGTGLDVIGGNTGTATLDVSVDGSPLATSATTLSSGKHQATYALRGLADGAHSATFVLRSGTLVIDAFTAISGAVDGAVDTTPIRNALTAVGTPVEAEYSPQSWAVFATTRAQAAALPGRPGLDTIGVGQLAARLEAAFANLVRADITPTKRDLGLAGAVRTTDDLPATVTIDGQSHAVTWTAASRNATRTAYATVSVEGWTNDAYVDGKKQAFTARYEVVPASLVYYIDGGLAAGQTSPQFQAVKASDAGSGLRNGTADQVSATADGWGYVNDGINIKGSTDPAEKFSTGYWAGGNKTVRYRLPLDPGQYVLTSGFTEWYGQTRPMSETVTVGGTTVTGTPISLTASTTRATGTVSFTVTTPTVVTYTVAKTGSQDPVISWLAVAKTVDLGVAGTVPAGSALPATVTIAGTAAPVTWDKASAAKTTVAYETLSLTGTATIDGVKTAVAVRYEVVPTAPLVYFIDSGVTGGQTSPAYEAVKASATGAGLRNATADQVSTASEVWGYLPDGATVKTGVDLNDKYATGLWAGTGKPSEYNLPLDPGVYELTAGFNEWWGETRPMAESVTFTDIDGEQETVTGPDVTISGTTPRATGKVTFTLHAPATVRYTAAKATTQDPVISWLAVARTGDATTAPGAPTNVTAVAGDAAARVTWSAPASDGGTPITGYTVTAEPGGATCVTTGATGCQVTGLDNGTAYTFTVVARTSLTGSPASAPSAAVTPFWIPRAVVITGAAQVVVGQRTTLVAGVDPAQADQAVTWQSSNPAVATVSAAGVVTGVAYGQAVIRATSVAAPQVSASRAVMVVPATWSPTAVYVTGDRVLYNGRVFLAQWWTQGQTPGASPWSAWAEAGTPVGCRSGTYATWTNSWVYTGGEVVQHQGHLWQAKWWTRNQAPGDPYGPWQDLGDC